MSDLETEEKEAQAQLDILRALKVLPDRRRVRVVFAIQHLLDAEALVPGITSVFVDGFVKEKPAMIENQIQYKVTKSMVEQFEAVLRKLDETAPGTVLHPLALKAEKNAIRSQLESLRAEIADYEKITEESKRSGWGS